MFCYACVFDLVVLDFFGLFFLCFCVSLDHFGFVFFNFVLLGLVFFSAEPRDWLGRTSPK